MSELTYSKSFSASVRGVFSLYGDEEDRKILAALQANDFSLGSLLFNYVEKIEIDLETLEFLLTETVELINKGKIAPLVSVQNKKIKAARDILKKKRTVKKLHADWVAIYKDYERQTGQRVPVIPCVVRRAVSK